AVVNCPSQAMAETMFVIRIARTHDHLPGRGIDLEAFDTRTQRTSAGFNCLDNRIERPPDRVRRPAFTRSSHVPHPLKIRAVALVPQTKVDMDEMSRLDTNC